MEISSFVIQINRSSKFEVNDSSVSLDDDDEGMKKCAIHFAYTSRQFSFFFFFFSLQITMEMNEQNLQALCTYLRQTLSVNATERSEGKLVVHSSTSLIDRSLALAEKTLKQIERNEQYSSLLLTLCDRSTTPDDVRRASVITFKNFIKRNWPSLDNSNVISLQDRNHIKEHIVELMTRSPEHIQEQLSEAITVIGQCDFPEQWPNLLETLIRQFQQQQSSNSFQSINGVLKTAHSLFERYRYEQKSDELWLEIKLVLEKFAPAFTQLFQVRERSVQGDVELVSSSR